LLTRETIHPPPTPQLRGMGGIVRMVGGLRLEPWAPSAQNAGRYQIGIGGRLTSETAPGAHDANRRASVPASAPGEPAPEFRRAERWKWAQRIW
jgi:hypothetical protein